MIDESDKREEPEAATLCYQLNETDSAPVSEMNSWTLLAKDL